MHGRVRNSSSLSTQWLSRALCCKFFNHSFFRLFRIENYFSEEPTFAGVDHTYLSDCPSLSQKPTDVLLAAGGQSSRIILWIGVTFVCVSTFFLFAVLSPRKGKVGPSTHPVIFPDAKCLKLVDQDNIADNSRFFVSTTSKASVRPHFVFPSALLISNLYLTQIVMMCKRN